MTGHGQWGRKAAASDCTMLLPEMHMYYGEKAAWKVTGMENMGTVVMLRLLRIGGRKMRILIVEDEIKIRRGAGRT